jgi:hypothetical protein
LITIDLLRGLSEPDRIQRGWPVHSFMREKLSVPRLNYFMTIERLITQFPPEMFPGFYDRAICASCHGQDVPCGLCGGDRNVCPRCRNMGYVYRGNGAGMMPCDSCDKLKREAVARMERFWKNWGLTETEKSWTFDKGAWLDLSPIGAPWLAGYKELVNWLCEWSISPGLNDYHWIVMLDESGDGNYGAGKSYLGTCVVNEALANGQPAHKWQTADLLGWLRDRLSPDDGISYAEWFRSLKEFPGILFLDEFGWEKISDWVMETLVMLLTYRAERTWLPTVIAGNISVGEVSSTLPWLASRLNERSVFRPAVLSQAPDWRIILKEKAKKEGVPDELL